MAVGTTFAMQPSCLLCSSDPSMEGPAMIIFGAISLLLGGSLRYLARLHSLMSAAVLPMHTSKCVGLPFAAPAPTDR